VGGRRRRAKKSIHNLRRGLNASVNLFFMFPRLLWFFCAASLVFHPTLRAQFATVPPQFGSAPAPTLSPGETQTVDLRTLLGVPGITGQVMRFETLRWRFNPE